MQSGKVKRAFMLGMAETGKVQGHAVIQCVK